MRSGLRLALALALTFGVSATACGDDSSSDAPRLADTATIEFAYRDASVPPEFHRSYRLSISHDEVSAVVDSYGDVLYDATNPIGEEVWGHLADTNQTVTDLESDDTDDGCTGGTGRSLVITEGDDMVVDVDFEVCGGVNSDAADIVDAYVGPVLDAIPDWDQAVGV